MVIVKLGNPPFPAKQIDEEKWTAKIEHVWHLARRYAKANGYEYINSFGVAGIAPT